jgi:hypothetical protein
MSTDQREGPERGTGARPRPGAHRAGADDGGRQGWRGLLRDPRAALRGAGLSVVVAAVLALAVLVVTYQPGQEAERPAAPEPTPLDEGARQAPEVVLATRVLTTWSDGDQGYRRWWSRLEPLLTPGGREAYAFTDPRQVPDLGTVKATEMLRGADGTTVTVWFSTDEGRFGVDVSRRGPRAPWRANRVLFPGQESVFA